MLFSMGAVLASHGTAVKIILAHLHTIYQRTVPEFDGGPQRFSPEVHHVLPAHSSALKAGGMTGENAQKYAKAVEPMPSVRNLLQ